MNTQNKKNIVIIANDFTTIYHFRMEFLKKLIESNYEVIVAVPHDERNVAFNEVGCTVYDISMSRFGTNPFKDFKTMLEIKKIIHKSRPSSAFTYTAKPNIYGGIACSLEHVPYICTVTGLGINFANKNFISRIMLFLQQIAFRKAKKVFFQNDSNRELFLHNRIAVNNNELIAGSGVNLKINSYEQYPDNNTVKFISAARVRQDKGYDELFSAIKECYNAGKKVEFHIIGWYEDDAYKDIVYQMQKTYGVKFYDYVPHEKMHSLISECDCLIQPSHHEGMSNVILEASAAGRPCIVSDIPGCREGVDDGITGFYFKVKDSVSLTTAIFKFLDIPREQRIEMGIKARKKMESEFDRFDIVDKYINEII